MGTYSKKIRSVLLFMRLQKMIEIGQNYSNFCNILWPYNLLEVVPSRINVVGVFERLGPIISIKKNMYWPPHGIVSCNNKKWCFRTLSIPLLGP